MAQKAPQHQRDVTVLAGFVCRRDNGHFGRHQLSCRPRPQRWHSLLLARSATPA